MPPLLKKKNKKRGNPRINEIWIKKGETRNPNGRPLIEKSISGILRALGEEKISEPLWYTISRNFPDKKREDIQLKDAVLMRCYVDAISQGNDTAREFIAQRTEGKVKDVTENTNLNTEKLEINYQILPNEKKP